MEDAESGRPKTAKVIAELLEVSRRELLDLGLRNPLLKELLFNFILFVHGDHLLNVLAVYAFRLMLSRPNRHIIICTYVISK